MMNQFDIEVFIQVEKKMYLSFFCLILFLVGLLACLFVCSFQFFLGSEVQTVLMIVLIQELPFYLFI